MNLHPKLGVPVGTPVRVIKGEYEGLIGVLHYNPINDIDEYTWGIWSPTGINYRVAPTDYVLLSHPKLRVTAGATVKVADWSESPHRGVIGKLVFERGQWGILPTEGKTIFEVPEWDFEHYHGENPVEEDPLGEYCTYCGTYQGPAGEARIGFDCYYCGCN